MGMDESKRAQEFIKFYDQCHTSELFRTFGDRLVMDIDWKHSNVGDSMKRVLKLVERTDNGTQAQNIKTMLDNQIKMKTDVPGIEVRCMYKTLTLRCTGVDLKKEIDIYGIHCYMNDEVYYCPQDDAGNIIMLDGTKCYMDDIKKFALDYLDAILSLENKVKIFQARVTRPLSERVWRGYGRGDYLTNS